jgi:hypothetical protein
VTWDAVEGATGYRVARSTSSGGPFTVSADVDLTDGTARVEAGVTNVYSDQLSFFPHTSAPPSPAPSENFYYVEVTSARTYFRVTACSDAGDARRPSPCVPHPAARRLLSPLATRPRARQTSTIVVPAIRRRRARLELFVRHAFGNGTDRVDAVGSRRHLAHEGRRVRGAGSR